MSDELSVAELVEYYRELIPDPAKYQSRIVAVPGDHLTTLLDALVAGQAAVKSLRELEHLLTPSVWLWADSMGYPEGKHAAMVLTVEELQRLADAMNYGLGREPYEDYPSDGDPLDATARANRIEMTASKEEK